MQINTHTLVASSLAGGIRARLLSLSASAVVCCVIFVGIIQMQKTKTVHNVLVFDELETVILPSPPAPPPRYEKMEKPPPPDFLNVRPNAFDSTLEIAYNPQENFQPARPSIEPQISFDVAGLKPGFDGSVKRQVYRKHEVDQAPIPIYKKIPKLSTDVLKGVDIPRVLIMYIVDTSGSVQNVSLLGSSEPDFDRVILSAVEKWRFKPAIKDGKEVRCWIKQAVEVKTGSANPFSTQ